MIYEGEIKSLNNLRYWIDKGNDSWINEEDIIQTVCQGNSVFYMTFFMGETYLNLANKNGTFPLLHVLIAVHEVFEYIADLKEKSEFENRFIENVYPFIIQLAKIGAKEMSGKRPPLYVMEELLMNKEK